MVQAEEQEPYGQATNKIDSNIVNNLEYFSNNKILNNFGLVSNFEIYLKNINSIGKK